MKEFVEKLIGRLEEDYKPDIECFESKDDYEVSITRYNRLLNIVNQLAEEYKPQLNDNDSIIVESLPSLYPMKEFEEETLQRVIGCAKKEYNNGWIPCSERLPETYEYVLVWCKGRFIDGTHVGEECEWYGIGVRYGKEWTVHQCKDIRDIEVLAWMLLPAPYKKGE